MSLPQKWRCQTLARPPTPAAYAHPALIDSSSLNTQSHCSYLHIPPACLSESFHTPPANESCHPRSTQWSSPHMPIPTPRSVHSETSLRPDSLSALGGSGSAVRRSHLSRSG